jgi:hypothetical protein
MTADSGRDRCLTLTRGLGMGSWDNVEGFLNQDAKCDAACQSNRTHTFWRVLIL